MVRFFYKMGGQHGQGGVLTIRAWLSINFGITSLANTNTGRAAELGIVGTKHVSHETIVKMLNLNPTSAFLLSRDPFRVRFYYP